MKVLSNYHDDITNKVLLITRNIKNYNLMCRGAADRSTPRYILCVQRVLKN